MINASQALTFHKFETGLTFLSTITLFVFLVLFTCQTAWSVY